MENRKPRGRALVVGVPGATLKAVDRDVQAMAAELDARGFAVDLRTGERATRSGILAGYDDLIHGIGRDEPAVFYYAGHGFNAVTDNEPLRSCQGICPTDLHDTSASDFRGITSWELSIKLAQLTQRTKNATVILDCCCAAQMSRAEAGLEAIPRALPYPLHSGFTEHLRALAEMYGPAFDAVHPLGNPDAVRLVACEQNGSAIEYRTAEGEYRGAFTSALLDVLREVDGVSVSWAAIEPAIRARVQGRSAAQRPTIEGPSRRRLFSLDEQADVGGAVPIVDLGDGFQLEAGQLMGVTVGDVYGVMPSGCRTYDPAQAIAEARVVQISATRAEVPVLDWRNGHTALPANAVATPLEIHAVRRPVAIDVPDDVRADVERKIAETGTLQVAGPGDAVMLPTLRLVGTALTIEDRAGPLAPAARFPDGLQAAIEHLVNLGAAQAIRDLEGEHGVSTSELEIAWGTVEHGQMQRMPERGGALALDDKLYLRVRRTTQRTLHVHVFNIGLTGQIRSMTRFAPTGVPLGDDFPEVVLGRRPDGSLPGLRISWPAAIPRDGVPRLDEVIVIVTSAAANLQGLETTGPPGAVRGEGSRLENLFAQIRGGLPRGTRGEPAIDGFLVKRLSYLLHPRDAVMADTAFAIDRNPLRQAVAMAPGAWTAPRDRLAGSPASRDAIAIEIEELAVDTEVLGSDLRFDALVCTRSRTASGYHAWTERCHGAVAGERLALVGRVLFEGPVLDFVDLHLWVSRDAPDSPGLTQLLAQRSATPVFEDAARSLVVTEGSPEVARIAAAGASAVLARIARDAVVAAVGRTIGLYRASFPAHERFGTGRHPRAGLQRMSSFCVALRIRQIIS